MASQIEIDVSANIAKFKAAMDKAALEGKKLNQRLGKAFKGIKNAMRAVSALAGVALAGGMASMAKSAINAADNIQKLGIKTGATAEFLSEMRLALSQSAVSQGEFETALRKINKSTADAAAGLSTQTRAFAALGISVEDFQKLNTDQKFITLSEAISKVKDPATRTQAAMDIMGRSGESLLTVMENGAEGISNYRNEAIKLGQSLSQDQVNAAAAANDALDKLTKSISGGFSQSILNYTEQIKQAADFTREYLPRSIEFLIDIFRGLKAVVQGVVLAILTSFKKLFQAAEKLPLGLGDNFTGVAKFFTEAADIIEVHLEENISKMGQWRQSSVDAAKEIKNSGAVIRKDFIPALSDIKAPVAQSKEEIQRLAEETKRAAKVMKELEQAGKDFADNIPKRAAEELADAMTSVRNESFEATRRQLEFDAALKNGSIKSGREAAAVAAELGVKYKDLSKETGGVTTVMVAHWERFKDSAFSSLQTFWRDGLDGTKNFSESIKNLFKDMVAGVLAQITKMIASNVFKKFLSFISGGKLGSNVGIFDGIFNGITGGKGQEAVSLISQVSGGLGSIASAVSGINLTSALTVGDAAILGIGKVVAGAKAAGAAILGAGKAIVTALGPIGLGIAGVLAIKKLFGKKKSPEQIALEQLGNVDKATKEGRNEQVILGNNLSFLGGQDENNIFFGLAGRTKEELDKVGGYLQDHFDFKATMAVKEGVLRTTSAREFSKNNDQIVAEIKAATAAVDLSLAQSEIAMVASIGENLRQLDKLYDQAKAGGLSSAQALSKAWSNTFNITESEANKALKNIGISTERLGQVFDEVSDGALNALAGIANNGVSAANVVQASFGGAANSVNLGLDSILNNSDRVRSQIRDSWNALGSEIRPINVPITASTPNDQLPQNKQVSGDVNLVVDAINRKTRAELETMRQARNAA